MVTLGKKSSMSDLASANMTSVVPGYMILVPVIKYHSIKLKNVFKVEL